MTCVTSAWHGSRTLGLGVGKLGGASVLKESPAAQWGQKSWTLAKGRTEGFPSGVLAPISVFPGPPLPGSTTLTNPWRDNGEGGRAAGL